MPARTFARMNWKKCVVLLFSAGLTASPFGTQAQVMDSVQHNLQSVIITVNKSNGPGGSGQYITRQTLEKLNQVNVNHVMRIMPGVNVRDEEGFGLRPNIGLRGTAVNRSAKITLMEDGVL
ncbi:MAG: TonB-dependent receptor, partial [Chitinophagaceae bacterium]|nr:TonB-dependent receptor [Chitinophagaceae bacterium]